MANGLFYKPVGNLRPPGPITGHVHENCYQKATLDCSPDISREHFLSASVLRLIDERLIKVKGPRWVAEGTIKEVPIKALRARILCKRHNEALAPLDQSAYDFFRAVREIFDDIANLKTLSRKPKWFLFSGEELELWLVKTAFGLYQSGNLAKGHDRLSDHQSLNPAILSALQGGKITPPCGLYVMATPGKHVGQRNSIDITVISSTDEKHMTGLSLAFMGLTFLIALDPQASYRAFTSAFTYRPDFLQFRNEKRFHSVILTWPDIGQRKQRALLYTKA